MIYEPLRPPAIQASSFEQRELQWPAGLLLNYDDSLADATAAYQLADPDFDQITASQLSVERKNEQRSISKPVLLEPEAHSPDLLRMERPLRSKVPASIPRGPTVLPRIRD